MNKRKVPLSEVPAPGPGPWWAFMMVDVDPRADTKKTTEVRLDTYPELIKEIKNTTEQGDWVIVMRLGPFVDLDFALAVFSNWSEGTRGPGPRIAQGICLWNYYAPKGVEMWVIDQTKQEVQQLFDEGRRRGDSGDSKRVGASGRVEPGHMTAREVLAACKSGTGKMGGKKKKLTTTTVG